MSEISEAAARDEIRAIFRKSLRSFAVHTAVAGALIGALFTVFIQLMRDTRDMSLATAWDLFTHLPPWEWVAPGTWALMILGGGVLSPLFLTTAYYLAERPRWER